MTWTADDIPGLRGLTALVTGPTSGLGLETARLLASRGARVLLAARDVARAEASSSPPACCPRCGLRPRGGSSP